MSHIDRIHALKTLYNAYPTPHAEAFAVSGSLVRAYELSTGRTDMLYDTLFAEIRRAFAEAAPQLVEAVEARDGILPIMPDDDAISLTFLADYAHAHGINLQALFTQGGQQVRENVSLAEMMDYATAKGVRFPRYFNHHTSEYTPDIPTAFAAYDRFLELEIALPLRFSGEIIGNFMRNVVQHPYRYARNYETERNVLEMSKTVAEGFPAFVKIAQLEAHIGLDMEGLCEAFSLFHHQARRLNYAIAAHRMGVEMTWHEEAEIIPHLLESLDALAASMEHNLSGLESALALLPQDSPQRTALASAVEAITLEAERIAHLAIGVLPEWVSPSPYPQLSSQYNLALLESHYDALSGAFMHLIHDGKYRYRNGMLIAAPFVVDVAEALDYFVEKHPERLAEAYARLEALAAHTPEFSLMDAARAIHVHEVIGDRVYSYDWEQVNSLDWLREDSIRSRCGDFFRHTTLPGFASAVLDRITYPRSEPDYVFSSLRFQDVDFYRGGALEAEMDGVERHMQNGAYGCSMMDMLKQEFYGRITPDRAASSLPSAALESLVLLDNFAQDATSHAAATRWQEAYTFHTPAIANILHSSTIQNGKGL